jgi:hypothetical protein
MAHRLGAYTLLACNVGVWAQSQLRFTGWHDALADRKKKLYEKDTQMLTIQTTRELALRAIVRHMRARVPGAEPRTDGTDMYEFGVYTGGGLRMWLRMMHSEGLSFSGSIWGFDSFEGMPSEDNRFKTKLRQRDKGWLAGGLNTAEQMGIPDWDTLCRTIIKNIGHSNAERVHMLRGFYNESLAGGRRLAHRFRMRPALLVDLDCDLYTSSIQALRFVLDAGVLLPGGYIYLDDIMPWVWRDARGPALEQKLAFREITAEYGLQWEEVPLNATRRDRVYERPVLMLAACGRCRKHGPAGANGGPTDAMPPACIDARARG